MTKEIFRPTFLMIPGMTATGKTTMAKHLEQALNDRGIPAKRPIPYTTRRMRAKVGERHGDDYFFITPAEYTKSFLPLIERDPPGTWDVSCIGNAVYFNKTADTAPDENYPASILPVHFGELGPMRDLYGALDGVTVREIAIIIPDEELEIWKCCAREARPNRDLEEELALQVEYLRGKALSGLIFEPGWDLSSDCAAFVTLALSALDCLADI